MSQLAMLGGTPLRTKPFPSWPVFDEREERALLDVLRSGKWWRYSYGEGVEMRDPEPGQPRSRVVEFQEAFARLQTAKYGIACANGTAAIEVALKALGIGPGDEVIVPAYTFIATASSVLMLNAIPIFVDIEEDTFNIDPRRVEEAITPNTKVILPVHFAGLAADMEALQGIAQRHNLLVVEDAAHAHGATWNDQGLGSIGNAGTFSFQASKNMTAGEGGLITTNDRDLAMMCEALIWAGRKVGRPWYEHHWLGWNYRLTEFQGAILLEQLKRIDDQNARRRQNALYLTQRLASFPGIRPVVVRDFATKPSFHIYPFRINEAEFGVTRQDFLLALEKEGIPCFGGYVDPLYKNPMFVNQAFYPHGCPVTCGHYAKRLDYMSFAALCPVSERICREAVWLEHRLLLAEQADMDDIADAIEKIHEHRLDFKPAAVHKAG
jgi:dTDP-4-amino-4,6-dideoxygalactose transaminase